MLRPRRLSFFLLATLSASFVYLGCGEDPSPSTAADAGDGGGSDAPAAADSGGEDAPKDDSIVIESFQFVDARKTDGGVREFPEATPDASAPAAYVPTDGGYEVYPGVVESPTLTRIREVPYGRYFYTRQTPQISTTMIEQGLDSDGRSIRFVSNYYTRRPEKAADGSWVRINATSVSPWESTDTIEIMSRGAEIWRTSEVDENPESTIQRNPPGAGATSFAWELDMKQMSESYGYELFRATADDDLVVVHSRTSNANLSTDPNDRWSLAKLAKRLESFDAHGTTFVSGGLTTISGAFAPIPDRTLSLDVRGTAFVDAIKAAVPETTVRFTVGAVAEPGTDDLLYVGYAPSLFDITGVSSRAVPVNPDCYPANRVPCDPTTCPAGCTDERTFTHPGNVAATVHYGNPYAADAVELLFVRASYSITRKDPISGQNETMTVGAYYLDRISKLSGAAIAPPFGLPANITIGGTPVPVFERTDGVGETPVIAWSAPAFGTPEYYVLEIFDSHDELPGGGTISAPLMVATIRLRGTSVQLPPGVLVEGHHYAARVTARSDGFRFDL
ncbi:MAG: hypothetical protein K0S65_1866, partial [Labilithrix sp.]|nr:hypothetical protein [Labilithrix sp.]